MENQLVKSDHYAPTIQIQEREEWLKRFDVQPERVEKYGGDYVPISVIEHNLNQDYLGLWSIDEPTYQVVANQIVGTAVLSVFDLNAKVWLRRVGYGAVVIRQTKDASVTDASAIIKNALVMDFPKLRTECLKSAAKTLGKKYGGDLNRKIEDNYEPIYSIEMETAAHNEQLLHELTFDYAIYKPEMSAQEIQACDRVINNKEVNSYTKMSNLLSKFKNK